MADLPLLLLATAATVVHAGLLMLAPLLAEIAQATATLIEGRTPPAIGQGWRSLTGSLRAGGAVAAGHAVPNAARFAAAGFALAAALVVPSFATGMLTAPIDDLPLVALLLIAGRLAGLLAGAGPAELSTGLVLAALQWPALLLASLALALLAGGTGLDAAIAAAPTAAAVPLGLAVLSVAVAGVVDCERGAVADEALAGPVLALNDATAQLRLLVWLDLLAALLPPWSTTPASAGPGNWLAALLIWPVKVALLAVGLGICRVLLGAARSAWRPGALRAASLLALLGSVFVLIGQSFE